MQLQSQRFLPFILRYVITAPAMLLILALATLSYSADSYQNGQPHAEPVPVQDMQQDSQSSMVNEDIPLAAGQKVADEANLYAEIPGVGSFFGTMLDLLISVTNTTESRFKTLYTSIPLIFPDLHKVFITL